MFERAEVTISSNSHWKVNVSVVFQIPEIEQTSAPSRVFDRDGFADGFLVDIEDNLPKRQVGLGHENFEELVKIMRLLYTFVFR